MRTAIITGITGQDGSYLSELLLRKGYAVHGIIRRSSSFNTGRIDHLYRDPHEGGPLSLHYGDLTDAGSIRRILQVVQPDEIYHLGAQSQVAVSYNIPSYSVETVAMGTLHVLDAVRDVCPGARVYNASSSEVFGNACPPQDEETHLDPRSPYACAKAYALYQSRNYRDAYGLYISNGILFNHESPRRGETFVTRKITRAVGRIVAGTQEVVYLGNLDARRDWGYAGDYVEAMWLMLQESTADDYTIATGQAHSVREWLVASFAAAGIEDWRRYVRIDARYIRPSEVNHLCGNATKAQRVLGWKPSVTFTGLVEMMTVADIELAYREKGTGNG